MPHFKNQLNRLTDKHKYTMAQFGKASSKRGKPTYAYAIIGVALVLFLFGIVGWFFLNLRKTGDYVKENIQVHAWLNADASKKRIDSLQKYITISVPLQTIVVTSTTNIPFLEMLHVEKKLVGFPHTDYVSSEKTRKLIDAGAVNNIGQNEKLNTEQLIELAPDLMVTFGIDNNNPMIDNLQKSGLKVLIQADWMEQTPLGKAEWIKLYGALFGKEKEAKLLFDGIVKNYNDAKQLVASQKPTATVLYGSMYQDQWYVARGNSWVAQFMKDAKANYLWADVEGTGSLSLSFEKILEKAKTAKYWIATGSFKNLAEFENSNPHYDQFDALKSRNVYTFESKLGSTGGTVYYEVAASRPDLVLKDYIKIFHPELLPNYTFTFAQKLN